MQKRLIALLAIAALAGGFAVTSGAGPISGSITTSLSGRDEVPKGEEEGSGVATIKLDVANGKVCWTFRVSGVKGPNAAHIHKAPAGKAGPVVVPFFGGAYKPSGCASAKPALVRAILDNPTQYYVNIHNAEYPPGAVRGQL